MQVALRQRGLSVSGTKEQLIERLQAALAQEEESDDEECIALEEMSKEELRVWPADGCFAHTRSTALG